MRNRKFYKTFFKFFLLIIQLIDSVKVLKRNEWKIKKFHDKPVFQVVINKINNELVVGARNAIYRLKPKFILEEEFLIQEIENSNSLSFIENDIKILALDYKNPESPTLLACSDAYQSTCFKFNSINLKDHQTIGSTNDRLNFVGSKNSSFAFFAPFFGENVLVIAHSYDGRPPNLSPPLISLRKLNGNKGFTLFPNPNSSSAVLDINPKHKSKFQINFMYSFNYNNSSYFLTTQPISLRNIEETVTKLIKISRKNETYFEFMEIQLVCDHEFYNNSNYETEQNSKRENKTDLKATAAYFRKETHDLFVAFVEETDDLYGNNTNGSTICAFNLKIIESAFLDSSRNCSLNEKTSLILDQNENCQKTSGDKDLFVDNRMISINTSLHGLFLNSIKEYITSLAVTIQKSRKVAIIGTKSGKLMKISIGLREKTKKIHFDRLITEMFDELKEDSHFKQIRANPAFDDHEKNLYLLTHYHVIKVPIGSCALYPDCASCLDSDDPLGCGWCYYTCYYNSQISNDSKCYENQIGFPVSRRSCLPIIVKFTPESGPLSGRLTVKIQLNVLNYTKISDISVTIAGIECEFKSYNNLTIKCISGAANKETFGPIIINYILMDTIGRDRNLTDGNQYNGSSISKIYFKYENITTNQIEKQKLNKNLIKNLIIYILVSMVLFILFGFGFLYFYRTTRNEKNESHHKVRYVVVHSSIDPSIEDPVTENYLNLNNVPELITKTSNRIRCKEEFVASMKAEGIFIEISDLSVGEQIGAGGFGRVFKGSLNSSENGSEEVAIKTLNTSIIIDSHDMESFLEEGLLMKDFDHCNVLKLRGICFDEDCSPLIILPFMSKGDLLSYLRDTKNMLTVEDLLIFAIGIAKGMDYLVKKKFVHRDLAARNCLLDTHLCVKISDFGLSRNINEKNYYRIGNRNCRLPIKWMSPESLKEKTFNSKTDVWSYGVLVWELMTRGDTPYPDVELDSNHIFVHLKSGKRLTQPANCPHSIYSILLKCWSDCPHSRPHFEMIYQEIDQVLYNMRTAAKLI